MMVPMVSHANTRIPADFGDTLALALLRGFWDAASPYWWVFIGASIALAWALSWAWGRLDRNQPKGDE